VRDEQSTATRLDVDNSSARDDVRRGDDGRGVVDERPSDPRR
jgi:hypothetical protein